MVAMLGLPWAWRTTSAGLRPNLLAQTVHTRATAGVESTRTPSISNSNARQRICIGNMIISLRGRMGGEMKADVWQQTAVPKAAYSGCQNNLAVDSDFGGGWWVSNLAGFGQLQGQR